MSVEKRRWGSDSPHRNGVWAESLKYFADPFGYLRPDQVLEITCDNPARSYGLKH